MKYIFRGLTIFDYDEATGKLTTELVQGTDKPTLNHCNYIDQDFENFEKFFNDIKEFRAGRKLYLNDYIVN